MRILHIIPAYKPAFGYGGPTESVSKLCEGLASIGHIVDVYTTTANGENELDVDPGIKVVVDGVNVFYFKRLTGDPTHVSPGLWAQLYRTKETYDVIHIHSWWNILVLVAMQISSMSKIKVIVSPRGMLSDYIFSSGKSTYKKMFHSLIGRRLLAKSRFHATANSEYLDCTKLIQGWDGFVLPNILSLPDLDYTPKENATFTMIYMSRIHPKKGLENLLEAIKVSNTNVLLKIAGSGEIEYIKSLKLKVQQLELEGQVEWVGWVDRTEKFFELASADLFVLVSLNENFANVVIESLHMGTAVLISEDVGLSQYVEEKNLGWVCSLEVNSIAENIKLALKDKIKRDFIRQHGRSFIESSFREDLLLNQYVSEYLK